MDIKIKGSVFLSGHSLCLILPKLLAENYKLKKGDCLLMVLGEDGIFIPLKKCDKK